MDIVRTLRIKSEDLKYKRWIKGVLLSKKRLQCRPNIQHWTGMEAFVYDLYMVLWNGYVIDGHPRPLNH